MVVNVLRTTKVPVIDLKQTAPLRLEDAAVHWGAADNPVR